MSDQSLRFRPPPRPGRPPGPPSRSEPSPVELVIDGRSASVPASWTILEACRSLGIDTPTLCYLENLTPVNVCRICVVELAGARTLVPACSRRVEAGMEIRTDSPRVRLSRKMVIEFLASSVDLSTAPQAQVYAARYGARPERYGPPRPPSGEAERDGREPGHHRPPDGTAAETVAQPVKIDNDLYVRDYGKCILCYKCVEACGTDAQNTFAIAVAGRGFDARISTEGNVPLPDSACVYCGNCIGVCPTGALMFRSEYELRGQDKWDESRQTKTDTICPYCGVGCTLSLHVQDNRIVKVTSPLDVEVTHGHLCIKGRFGFEFVHGGDLEADARPGQGAASEMRAGGEREGGG
jgi:predicted molibdopterin-dependent oxidoreductase YjgC